MKLSLHNSFHITGLYISFLLSFFCFHNLEMKLIHQSRYSHCFFVSIYNRKCERLECDFPFLALQCIMLHFKLTKKATSINLRTILFLFFPSPSIVFVDIVQWKKGMNLQYFYSILFLGYYSCLSREILKIQFQICKKKEKEEEQEIQKD